MICQNCGNEIPEESAFCLNCGAAIQSPSCPEDDMAQPDAVSVNDTPARISKVKWRWIIAAAVAIVALVAVMAYADQVTPHRLTSTQLYNEELGVGLKLGMSKSRVDKLLGEPERVDDAYCYRDTNLYAHYYNGKLAAMYVTFPNQRWHTIGGIVTGTDTDWLVATIGQPASIQHDDTWWYYYRGNQVAGFEINRFGGEIMSIYIYDENWPNH